MSQLEEAHKNVLLPSGQLHQIEEKEADSKANMLDAIVKGPAGKALLVPEIPGFKTAEILSMIETEYLLEQDSSKTRNSSSSSPRTKIFEFHGQNSRQCSDVSRSASISGADAGESDGNDVVDSKLWNVVADRVETELKSASDRWNAVSGFIQRRSIKRKKAVKPQKRKPVAKVDVDDGETALMQLRQLTSDIAVGTANLSHSGTLDSINRNIIDRQMYNTGKGRVVVIIEGPSFEKVSRTSSLSRDTLDETNGNSESSNCHFYTIEVGPTVV